MIETNLVKDEFFTKLFGQSPFLIYRDIYQLIHKNLDELIINFLDQVKTKSSVTISSRNLEKIISYIKEKSHSELKLIYINMEKTLLLDIFNFPNETDLPLDETFEEIKNFMFEEFLQTYKELTEKHELALMGKKEVDDELIRLDETLKLVDETFSQINEIGSTNFNIERETNLAIELLNQLENQSNHKTSLMSKLNDLMN